MNSSNKPVIAMIDAPDGGRFFFALPVHPTVYNPSIAVIRGVIRPAYVIPSHLGVRSVYSEGSARVCKKHREMAGIRAALGILVRVWNGVIENHPGACDDVSKQGRLAQCLTGSPEAAFAMIEKSGVLGNEGLPKYAPDLVRNVLALAHWGAIWQLRHKGKGRLLDGSVKPGGLHWSAAAAVMNQLCAEAFPDIEIRQWKDFTGTTLKGLMDRYLLDPASGV